MVEKEIEGKIIRKYHLEELVPQLNLLTGVSFWLIPRMVYEIEVESKEYALTTVRDCELPEGAKVKIGTEEKTTYLLYENKRFPVFKSEELQR